MSPLALEIRTNTKTLMGVRRLLMAWTTVEGVEIEIAILGEEHRSMMTVAAENEGALRDLTMGEVQNDDSYRFICLHSFLW